MMAPETFVEFACIEYRRDPEFRSYSCKLIGELRKKFPQIPLDTSSLEEIFSTVLPRLGQLAPMILNTYFKQLEESQYERAKLLDLAV